MYSLAILSEHIKEPIKRRMSESYRAERHIELLLHF